MAARTSGLPLAERILRGQGPEFAELLAALGEAVSVRGHDDRFLYANRAALRMFGMTSPSELVGHPLSAVLDRFVIVDERGEPVTAAALPSSRLLATGVVPEPLLVRMTARATGESRWQLLKVSAMRDEAGEVAAAVTMIEDVSKLKTAEVHTRVLAESGRVLAASLDRQQTLENVAGAALPGLADWCLVELVDGHRREHVVVAHVDPEQRALAQRLRSFEGPEPAEGSALGRVLASGRPELYREISDEHLRSVSVSDEQLEVFRRLEICSAIVVPMVAGARTIGAMHFFTSVSRRHFTDEDVELATQLARRAAVAVENARLHTTLGEVAQTLQRSLRPAPLPRVPDWEIAALYRPAVADQRVEVGGDFYEVFVTGGSAFAMIGDVTGHGVAAATMTTLMRYGARFASHLEPDPVAIVRRLDEELRRRQEMALCSTLCAALEDHSLILCSAGHPPALIAQRSGTVLEAPRSGPLLGAFADSDWHQERVAVGAGDVALLYTDGVTETSGPRDRFGSDRLRALLAAHAGESPAELLAALEAELVRFGGGPPEDDVAALALRPA